MQDATKVLLGSSGSSARDASEFDSDPASFPAGVAVSLASNGGLSLLKSAGMRVGVSLGRSLSSITKATVVLRAGERVPLLASLKRASCVVTITSYANLVVTSGDTLAVAGVTFTAQSGAVTPGGATFQAATSNNATAASLAAQINANVTANLKVVAVASNATVTIYSLADGAGATGTGNDIAVVYTDTHSEIGITIAGLSGGKLAGGSDMVSDIAYIVKGQKAYINDLTGKLDVAMSGFSTISDATYVDAPLTGINEDGASVAAGVVDMPGGL